MKNVLQPIHRGRLRQFLGKEFFILKRRMKWVFGGDQWAKPTKTTLKNHVVFKHQSMIMRPLKDVDMYLQENKRTNLRLVIKKIDKTIIGSGQTFSLWKLVGRPTKAKGYLEGLVLKQGKIDKGIGGGLCQLGNLLFWIFAHSPLTIVERHRHGYDVFPDINRKVPFGAGATLSYNYIDLQVKNETANNFQIQLWMDETHLHGQLIAQETVKTKFYIEERNHQINQQIWGGYTRHNQIFKIAKDEHGHKTASLLVENHAIMMYSPFIETKDKKH